MRITVIAHPSENRHIHHSDVVAAVTHMHQWVVLTVLEFHFVATELNKCSVPNRSFTHFTTNGFLGMLKTIFEIVNFI